MVNTQSLRDHFVICGWKEDMHELLAHILNFNPGVTAHDIVLVAPISQTVIDSFHEDPQFKDLQIIASNYWEISDLRRAAPERARKVMILADRTPLASGQIPSPTEVDARTVMTAMTLSNIARGTLVTAEILDPKMDQYLRLAGVSEIIYSREYSRLLLGNASSGTGVSNILFDLLDPKTPSMITTRPIVESQIGVKFSEYKKDFELSNARTNLIGILENTGNSHSIKEMALRQAQKTPDVSKLVQNLRHVKQLRFNDPVFNPPAEYVIPHGAMAIVIEHRSDEGRPNSGEGVHVNQSA